jgi:hypothetical protein
MAGCNQACAESTTAQMRVTIAGSIQQRAWQSFAEYRKATTCPLKKLLQESLVVNSVLRSDPYTGFRAESQARFCKKCGLFLATSAAGVRRDEKGSER